MRHERQVELLKRLQDSGEQKPWPLAEASVRNAASVYTSPQRLESEQRVLFRGRPILVGLSCELRDPGSFLSLNAGGVPIVVVRQPDGSVCAMINVCRHRGAPVVGDQRGEGMSGLSCPYHGWKYGLDGCLVSRPGAGAAFEDLGTDGFGLLQVPVAEQYGLIYVHASTDAPPFTVDDALYGAQEELRDYHLEDYCHVDTRSQECNFNWKLVLDTFTESYHIPWVHPTTLAPDFLFDRMIVDTFGPIARPIGLRKSVMTEFQKPSEDDWELLQHGTTQYLLVPNAILVYQIDHVELWRMTPLAPDRTLVLTSVFSSKPPHSERSRNYFIKNLDIVLKVTGEEDFPLQERTQRGLEANAMPEVVYGRNEVALGHYHTAINRLLAEAGEPGPGAAR
jgi:phenylpropionate dioxygenase-like ring-hydroxylating dioxygenase large terminal subunit